MRIQSNESCQKLCFLSTQLPYDVTCEIEVESKAESSLELASDHRELNQQDKNEFFAIFGRVVKFVRENEKWSYQTGSASSEVGLKGLIKKCLVLPIDLLLVVTDGMGRMLGDSYFHFLNRQLELI